MLVAYLVNEDNGERYFLDQTFTIGNSNCNIETSEPISFVLRVYHCSETNNNIWIIRLTLD